MTRPARLVAAVLAAAAATALTGCGGAPVRAGAAAVIGASRISTQQLSDDVSTSLADPGAAQLASDRPAFQREVLTRLLTADLVERVAARLGVSADQGQVDAQYSALVASVGGADQLKTQAASAGYTDAGIHDLARQQALRSAIGEKLTAGVQVPPSALQQAYQAQIDSFDQVRTAQVQTATLADAQALLPRAQGLDDAAFEALAKQVSLDTSTKGNGGDLGLQPRSAFEQNGLSDYGAAAFAAKVGDTFAVGSPQGGHVVRVLDRRTTTLAQATPQLRQSLLQQQQQDAVTKALKDEAARATISVSPRFGQWNAGQLAVVARAETGNRELSSPAADPGADPAAGPGTGSEPLITPQGQ